VFTVLTEIRWMSILLFGDGRLTRDALVTLQRYYLMVEAIGMDEIV
jgi:hypothetical protein